MDTVNLVVTRLHHGLRLLRHVDYVMSDLWRVWNCIVSFQRKNILVFIPLHYGS